MKKITLVCAGGVSTSILCRAIKDAATQDGFDVEVSAHALDKLGSVVDGTDVLLVAPQVSFRYDEIKNTYPNVAVELVDMMDYGAMNGKKIFGSLKEKYAW